MKRWSLVAVAGSFLVACGGGLTITSEDLAGIMPSASDAPAGTEIDTTTVGPKTLDEFVTDADVKMRLSALGYRVAYVAAFATPNYVPDRDRAPVGSAFYGTFAVVLKDEKAAEVGFDFYRERLKSRATNFSPLVTEDLGEEVFAFRFSELDDTPLPGLAMLWRRGNALFSIVGVGNPIPAPNVTRDLATRIDRRSAAAD